ncbi:hypothetical protein E2R54_02065 [Microbacterium oleivorans]|uniref:Uncharacterized protein n=1 Tax=Microbacterium oleivorans TaxID=273677 RepID=A0A4R5YNX5_9MICO|nr:hypothetical protein E2R54_02065 [Microbacterium oleivorans]
MSVPDDVSVIGLMTSSKPDLPRPHSPRFANPYPLSGSSNAELLDNREGHSVSRRSELATGLVIRGSVSTPSPG